MSAELYEMRARTVEENEQAVTVDPAAPLKCARALLQARFAVNSVRSLMHWQGEFWHWREGAWRPFAAVKKAVYEFLELAGQRPNRKMVGNVIDALEAVAHVSPDTRPPCWIGRPGDTRSLVSFRNVIVDVDRGEQMTPTPELFVLSALPIDYDPAAAEPAEWLEFLSSVWPNDAQSVETLQEIAGYLLTPDTSQQKIFLLVGPKRSGKGTILRAFSAMLGVDNVCAPTLTSLASAFGLQPLIGKLGAFIGDARLGGRADQAVITERLLSISGQDNVNIARKFLPDFTARLDVRFVLSTNELPRLTDSSGALSSRFVLLLLSNSFYGREDRTLEERLKRELPSIVNWAIDGRRRLLARGRFMQPEAAQDALDQLHDLGSPIGAFVRAECLVGPGLSVGTDRLFDTWKYWCEQQGREHVGSKAMFGRDLNAAWPGVRVAQRRDGDFRYRVYEGIGLQSGGGTG